MATASEIKCKNGYQKEPKPLKDGDVKVLVVGDRKCGKTTFIKAFWVDCKIKEKEDAATPYECEYELMKKKRTVVIYELDGSEESAKQFLKLHSDTNSFILMYAIDDPQSFEQLQEKWINRIRTNKMFDRSESAIVVGNKMDLRGNPKVIERLAQIGKSPITEDQGKGLLDNQRIRNYFDCSSIQPPVNVNEACLLAMSYGYSDVIGEVQGYHIPGPNQVDPEDA